MRLLQGHLLLLLHHQVLLGGILQAASPLVDLGAIHLLRSNVCWSFFWVLSVCILHLLLNVQSAWLSYLLWTNGAAWSQPILLLLLLSVALRTVQAIVIIRLYVANKAFRSYSKLIESSRCLIIDILEWVLIPAALVVLWHSSSHVRVSNCTSFVHVELGLRLDWLLSWSEMILGVSELLHHLLLLVLIDCHCKLLLLIVIHHGSPVRIKILRVLLEMISLNNYILPTSANQQLVWNAWIELAFLFVYFVSAWSFLMTTGLAQALCLRSICVALAGHLAFEALAIAVYASIAQWLIRILEWILRVIPIVLLSSRDHGTDAFTTGLYLLFEVTLCHKILHMHALVALWQYDASIFLLNLHVSHCLPIIRCPIEKVLISCLLSALIIIFLWLLSKGYIISIDIRRHVCIVIALSLPDVAASLLVLDKVT